MVLQVKKDSMRLYRDVETIKRQGGGNARQGHLYRPTIMCCLANESLNVHVPLMVAVLYFSNKVYSSYYNCTNTLNQVTFEFIPQDFVQNLR